MTLYETIFTRRSVRKYDLTALDAAVLADIQAVIDGVKQLPGQSARFTIVNADTLKGASSPHAILAHCGDGDDALCNLGYADRRWIYTCKVKAWAAFGWVWQSPKTPRRIIAF